MFLLFNKKRYYQWYDYLFKYEYYKNKWFLIIYKNCTLLFYFFYNFQNQWLTTTLLSLSSFGINLSFVSLSTSFGNELKTMLGFTIWSSFLKITTFSSTTGTWSVLPNAKSALAIAKSVLSFLISFSKTPFDFWC